MKNNLAVRTYLIDITPKRSKSWKSKTNCLVLKGRYQTCWNRVLTLLSSLFLLELFNHLSCQVNFQKNDQKPSFTHYKKENIADFNNYRGISLPSICSKLHDFNLNKHLLSASNKQTFGNLAIGYSTIHHIVTLFAMVQEHLLKDSRIRNYM